LARGDQCIRRNTREFSLTGIALNPLVTRHVVQWKVATATQMAPSRDSKFRRLRQVPQPVLDFAQPGSSNPNRHVLAKPV
jgi:hypothetical protein